MITIQAATILALCVGVDLWSLWIQPLNVYTTQWATCIDDVIVNKYQHQHYNVSSWKWDPKIQGTQPEKWILCKFTSFGNSQALNFRKSEWIWNDFGLRIMGRSTPIPWHILSTKIGALCHILGHASVLMLDPRKSMSILPLLWEV